MSGPRVLSGDEPESPPGVTSRGCHRSSLPPSPPQILTVKTPLLPQKSGINMESAQGYGTDVEKRALGASQATSSATYEQKPKGFRWMTAAVVSCLALITVLQGERVYASTERLWARITYKSEDLSARQSSNNASSNSSLHYGTLVPLALNPLPLGSIRGLGWLGAEMDNLADGLAGHEREFYPVVSQNPWTGGEIDYSILLEGFPYWLNGIIPLAYQTDNDRLKGQIKDALSYVFAHQDNKTGWLGPVRYGNSLDLWSRYPFLLGLRNLADADSTMTSTVLDSIYKFLPYANQLLADGQLVANGEDWARSRYADFILTLQWLFDKHPTYNGADQRGLLWQMMGRLRDTGIDWAGYYTSQSYLFQDIDTFPENTADGSFHFPYLHGVNVGQGLKTMAVDYRFTNNQSLVGVQRDAVEWTLKYHGAPSGTILGDERESSLAPNRGSELCTAVETMFSMHTIYSITGENAYADHAEMAAFNALPVMLTHDSWAHQYIALPNQPWAAPADGGANFWNVGDFGTTFGTSPNYPCCTVNHPQGYPKFLAATFMSVGNDGLGHVLLSPAKATTQLGNGANVQVSANTDYPFSDVITYSITSDKPFTFYVRVPGWASGPAVTVNGQQVAVTASSTSGLAPINVGSGSTNIQYILKSTLHTVARANDTVAIYRGALLYALDVGQVNTSTPGSADITRNMPPGGDANVANALSYYRNVSIEPASMPSQARDYNMSNTMPWNYAIDETTLKFFAYNGSSSSDSINTPGTVMLSGESLSGDASNKVPQLTLPIWGYQAPSQYVTGQACLVDWEVRGGIPFRPPLKGDRACKSSPVQVVFRPYGSLNLHMAELPTVSLVNGTSSK